MCVKTDGYDFKTRYTTPAPNDWLCRNLDILIYTKHLKIVCNDENQLSNFLYFFRYLDIASPSKKKTLYISYI